MLHLTPAILLAANLSGPGDYNPAKPDLMFIFRLAAVLIFGGMNLLYWFFMRNGQADYFEAIGKADELHDLAESKEEYAPKPDRPRHCSCGYDLSANQFWCRQTTADSPSRCPECSRAIDPDDYDLSPPPAEPVAEEEPTALSG